MNSPTKIGLDIDGVLANFTLAWHRLYPEISPTPNTWFLDDKIHDRLNSMRDNNILNDFYLNIEPYLDSINLPFKPHCYITSRPVPREITEEWLKKHKFPHNNVFSLDILTSKVSAAKESGLEVFVDDSYDNFIDLNNAGVKTYLYSQPWNIMYDVGDLRIDSLNDLPLH
jgi:hypothetical protein